MSVIKVVPDKTYLIQECRIRFEAPADIEPQMVPFYAFKVIEWSKDRFERFKGWRFLDRVPARQAFSGGKPCCTQIVTRKVGEPLTICGVGAVLSHSLRALIASRGVWGRRAGFLAIIRPMMASSLASTSGRKLRIGFGGWNCRARIFEAADPSGTTALPVKSI